MLHDNTYRCNRFGLPMGLFAGVDEFGKGVLLAQCLVDQEGTNDYEWAFTCYFSAVGKYPLVFFSDADLAVEAAMPTCVPANVLHLWCFFHIMMNVRKNLAPVLGGDVDQLLRDLRQVHQATDVTIAMALWERLITKWGEDVEVKVYLERQLGGEKMAKWCVAHHVNIFTASMTTTGRSESLNRVCKMFLSKRSTLVKVMEETLALEEHQATVRLHNRVQCEASWAEYGRISRAAFPSVYDQASTYLTPYGMRLLTKQAARCMLYDVEPCSYQAISASVEDAAYKAALRLASEEAPDADLADPPSFVAAHQFASSHKLCDGNSVVYTVKAQAAAETRGAPQTLILYGADETSGVFTRFYCSCGYSVRGGVPCRHFLAAVRTPFTKAGFHLGVINELWFKKPCTVAPVVHYHVPDVSPIPDTADVLIPPLQALVPGSVPMQAEGFDAVEISKLSEARSFGILLGESKDAAQAAMDHGKFAEFRQYLRAWITAHPIQPSQDAARVKNPVKKAARGRKRQTAAQLANAAKKRRDRSTKSKGSRSCSLTDTGEGVEAGQLCDALLAPGQQGQAEGGTCPATSRPARAPTTSRAPVRCGNCGSEGHNRRGCPALGGSAAV